MSTSVTMLGIVGVDSLVLKSLSNTQGCPVLTRRRPLLVMIMVPDTSVSYHSKEGISVCQEGRREKNFYSLLPSAFLNC